MDILAIIVLSILALVVLLLGLYLLVGYLSYRLSLSRKSRVKRKLEKHMEEHLSDYKIDLSWWDKFDVEDLDIINDGLKLYGHFIKNEGDKLVILVHGYGGNYKQMDQYAKIFFNRGFNILAVECRAHGKSEGNMVGMGWLDRLDLLKWIDKMLEINPNFKIVLMGISMGAATVCMTLGENLPKNVVCAISDCAFDNVYRQFSYIFTYYTHMSSKFGMKILNDYVKRAKNYDLKAADAVKQLKKSKLPIMFIHGSKDTFVPVEMVYRLADAVPDERKELYIVQDAEHIMSLPTNVRAYTRRVNKFLDKCGM